MGAYIDGVQDRAKTTFSGMLSFSVKLISSLFVGLSISLIFQELIGFETLVLLVFIAVLALSFLRTVWNWSLSSILIFDVFFVLVGALLRMYVHMAPGA